VAVKDNEFPSVTCHGIPDKSRSECKWVKIKSQLDSVKYQVDSENRFDIYTDVDERMTVSSDGISEGWEFFLDKEHVTNLGFDVEAELFEVAIARLHR